MQTTLSDQIIEVSVFTVSKMMMNHRCSQHSCSFFGRFFLCYGVGKIKGRRSPKPCSQKFENGLCPCIDADIQDLMVLQDVAIIELEKPRAESARPRLDNDSKQAIEPNTSLPSILTETFERSDRNAATSSSGRGQQRLERGRSGPSLSQKA